MGFKSFAFVVLGSLTDPILPTEGVLVMTGANHAIKIDLAIVRKRSEQIFDDWSSHSVQRCTTVDCPET